MKDKLTKSIIDYAVEEFSREENYNRMKTKIIDPIFVYVLDKVYPYIIISSIIFILTFILAILILFMMFKSK